MSPEKNKVKITLYVPCFNAEKYIKSCLEAILIQSFPIDEILVINDGSTDHTEDIARQYPVRIISHPFNRGLAITRNTALENAQGEFIATVDVDCLPADNWLQKLMQVLLSDPRCAGAGGKVTEVRENDAFALWRSVHMAQHWGKERSCSVPFLFGSNSVFRKEIIRRVGGYSNQYRTNYEDVDMSEKLKSAGYSLYYEPAAEVRHIREDTLSSLLNVFWNWNFQFHKNCGYYNDASGLKQKIKENFDIASRYIEEDACSGRAVLLYADFLMGVYLSLKDILYVHCQKFSSYDVTHEIPSIPMVCFLDLLLFSYYNPKVCASVTLIPPHMSYFQNLFAALILLSNLFLGWYQNRMVVRDILKFLIKSLIKIDERGVEFLLEKVMTRISFRQDDLRSLADVHPNIDRDLIQLFCDRFEKLLEKVNSEKIFS